MSELAAENLDLGSDAAAGATETSPPSRPDSRSTTDGGIGAGADRGISPVGGRFGLGKGGKAMALFGLLAGSGVFLAATWSHPHVHKPGAAASEPVKQIVDFASVRATAANASDAGASNDAAARREVSATGAAPTLAAPGSGTPSLGPLDGTQIVPAIAAGPGATGPGAAGSDASTSAASPRLPGAGSADPKAAAAQEAAAAQAAKLQAIRSAPLLAFSGDALGVAEPAAGLLASAAGKSEGGGDSELDQLRRGSSIGRVRAQRLPDRNFLVTAGALLPCVLETAMDTSAPGFVTCRITRDVYSDSGGVVLMEKGSRVLGEYRSGFSQGRARIFVLWDRITTPGGVAVDVSSPATDALGRAGFDGKIDSHFWQRFGGALLLTSVSGGISAAATADARFANVAQAPNEAAAAALQNSINIPPTLTKPQGSEVAIFVSRDLDFSTVYALKAR